MKLKLPFISRRGHDAEAARLRQRVLDTEARHDEAEGERRVLAARLAVETTANVRLDGRIKALTGQGKTRTASEVLTEHDVHRKALADALGEQKRHLNWDQLIDEVAGLRKSAVAWMEDTASAARRLDEEQRRGDVLQSRLDDAAGMPRGGPIKDSGSWQPGHRTPRPKPEVAP